MRVIISAIANLGAMTPEELAGTDADARAELERYEVVGEGETWVEAREAAEAQLPEGALILYTIRG